MTNLHRQPAPRTRDLDELRAVARGLRIKVVEMVAATSQGYVQQGLGAADLFAALYFAELRLDPDDPSWADRDRFLLSTAHNTAILYATLAARGLIDAERLDRYTQDGSRLEINASTRMGPVVEATCGSLGQGLSVGVGMATGARRHGRDARIYVMLGDGEMQEGQVWEAVLYAGNAGLSNLCVILDDNRMQAEGHTGTVNSMDPIAAKWQAFGFRVEEVDGHDLGALLAAFDAARRETARPTCIVARTLVGKGAPSLEGRFGHNMRLPAEAAAQAIEELQA